MTNPEESEEMEKEMTIEQARGIAARLWCDPEMGHITMDVHIAESIANLILKLDAQERNQ